MGRGFFAEKEAGLLYRQDYQFGGVRFALTAEVSIRTDTLLERFRVPGGKPDHQIQCRFAEQLPTPPSHSPLDTPEEKMWRGAGALCGFHNYKISHRDPLRPACWWRRQGDVTEMLWSEAFRDMLYARNVLMSADLFGILLEYGGLVLHAAYVAYQGQGILFSGPSGMGKSTQAALWEKYRGAEVINGDRTLIRRGPDGAFWAYGVCYSGTSGICKNVGTPLKALVLLAQGPENTVEPLGGLTAFRALLPRVSYRTWDTEEIKNATQILSALLTEQPVFYLTCRPDEGAVKSLEKYLWDR